MSLAPGLRIGTYEIVSALGEGGMGVVYRAKDTTLKREVALKVLPPDLAGDRERLARFEREAEVLATLNHPNIAQVYGFEKAASDTDQRALIMELVEGEDLSQVIARGPLTINDALTLARQVAEALEAAHEAGIIHRDLKPANIKVRDDGTVKVLDFGLAKAFEPDRPASGSRALANSPTITTPAMTMHGVILGTAAYMAPEQARGKPVDRRADIWAFGCVLFELLSGKKAFDGEEITDVLARVIEREPEWSQLPAAVPVRLRRLLERLLAKDRSKRFHHIGDVRCEIDEILHAPAEAPSVAMRPASPAWRQAAGYLAAAAAGAAVMMLAFQVGGPVAEPTAGHPLFVDIPLPFQSRGQAQLSPNGQYLAYTRRDKTATEVWLRDLSQPTPRRLGPVETGGFLVWAADGEALFVTESKGLRRFDIAEGTTVVQPATDSLTMVTVNPTVGAVMLPDRRIIIGAGVLTTHKTLQSWTPTGRSPLLPLDQAQSEVRQSMPARVAADRITYASHRSDGSVHLCVAGISGGQPRCAGLLNQSSPVHYLNGRIVFIRSGAVLTRAFDLEQASFTSDEQVLVEETSGGVLGPGGATILDATSGGDLGFITGQTTERLVWQGSTAPETPVAEVDATTTMALSPDGSRVLITERNNTLLLIDFSRGTTSQLGGTSGDAVWSPDGERFAHRTAAGIVTRSVADARERVILPGAQTGFPEDWSPDGRWIAAGLREGEFQAALVPSQGGELVPFVERDGPLARADEFHFSADGRWLAFNAESGGQNEVFVVPVPPTGERWQVSARGGVQPRWHRGQPTLYYLALDGMMMAVDISARPAFSASAPRPLFDTGLSPAANFDEYRVAPDGRFLIKKPIAQSTYRIVINWPALLAARSAGK